MKVRRSNLKDRVSVESYRGITGTGPAWGNPLTVKCFADATRRLVRDSNGSEVTAELTLTLHPQTKVGNTIAYVDPGVLFLPESRVTYQDRKYRVVLVRRLRFRAATTAVEVVCV